MQGARWSGTGCARQPGIDGRETVTPYLPGFGAPPPPGARSRMGTPFAGGVVYGGVMATFQVAVTSASVATPDGEDEIRVRWAGSAREVPGRPNGWPVT